MGILLLMVVLGAAAYLFFKSNTKRGIETVRASIFLSGMHAGVTVAEANHVASIDVTNGPSETIPVAMAHLKAEYDGKQLSMIADAYRQGMTPKLPLWYRVIADLRTDNEPSRHSYPESAERRPIATQDQPPDWVRPFVLYYVASEFAMALPGEMPLALRELALGSLSTATGQSMLVNLQNYLPFAYGRDRADDDLRQAFVEASTLVRAELQTGNSRRALERFLRRMHTENGAMTVSQNELDAIVTEAVDQIKESGEAAGRMRTLILKDCIAELFEAWHGKPFDAYQRNLLDYRAEGRA